MQDLNSSTQTGNYFKEFKEKMRLDTPNPFNAEENHHNTRERYSDVIYETKEELSHYFKLIYRIIKVIEESSVEDIEKFRYIKILRSQLSENEMLAIYYNSHSEFGGELYKMILKYNLLKHLPCLSKLEFCDFAVKPDLVKSKEKNSQALLLQMTYEVENMLSGFLSDLELEIRQEEFERLSRSYPMRGKESRVISFSATEANEIEIEITDPCILKKGNIGGLSQEDFINFFTQYLYDIFIYSNYITLKEGEKFIETTIDSDKLSFLVFSSKKLVLNTDFV